MEDGHIAESGTHAELLCRNGEYANLIRTYHTEETDADKGVDKSTDTKQGWGKPGNPKSPHREKIEPSSKDMDVSANLMQEEAVASGVVSMDSFKSYIMCGGGWFMFLCTGLFIMLANTFLVGAGAWLTIWLRSAEGQNQGYVADVNDSITDITTANTVVLAYEEGLDLDERLSFYGSIYAILFIICVLLYIFTSKFYVYVTLRAATCLHNAVFQKVIESPMSFFDTTPLGRILNRFTKDMDEVDWDLPYCALRFTYLLFFIVLGEIAACIFLPWNAVPFIAFIPVCASILGFFRRGFCNIKRLDSVCRSRMVSHLTATIQGHATIKAFGKSAYFIRRYESLVDSNTQLLQTIQMAIRWAAVRLDSVAALNAGFVAVIIIIWREHMSNASIGLVLYLVCNLCVGSIQTMFIAATETESSFVAVERMLEYIQTLKPEGPKSIKGSRPDATWPSEGQVQFNGVQMRYRPGLSLVLKDIHLDIKPRERIGIVGRTGSGKSSLAVVLFRLVELSGGSVLIDGVDIAKIGLHDLRSRLSVIPQDPVLFIGTVRYNLDPFNEHSDDDIWQALDKTHIKQSISDLEGKLEAPVTENGENFSVGERQLICLARALLRKSRILLLDEATAAIDTHTDNMIQRTIREAFQECTMLIIAHRLNTVLDCDKILVMDEGQVMEYDRPANLLSDQNSRLSAMLSAGGHQKQSTV